MGLLHSTGRKGTGTFPPWAGSTYLYTDRKTRGTILLQRIYSLFIPRPLVTKNEHCPQTSFSGGICMPGRKKEWNEEYIYLMVRSSGGNPPGTPSGNSQSPFNSYPRWRGYSVVKQWGGVTPTSLYVGMGSTILKSIIYSITLATLYTSHTL